MIVKVGKMDGTNGWNNVTWVREVEITQEELDLLIKVGYEYQPIGIWSRYDAVTKEITAIAIKK